ncbi:hypothetical protein GIB67_019174, partial [Kingdonia uniflora]
NIHSRALSSSRRRGLSRGSKPLPDGKKKKFGKFTNVLDEFIHIVKTELELTFDLRRVANFTILRHINDAWKRHKSRLNKKYIKDAFQSQSKKNTENCNKVKASCTTGRTSMAIVRHNLAVERNVLDEDVGRADVFIKAHTKANKTYQCPEIITFGKDKKGHTMDMGIYITPSFVANAIHIVEENEDLKATNNELKTMLLNMRKDLDDHIKKTSGAPQIQPSSSYNAPSNSLQATQRKQSDLNRECKLNGCPEGIVAYGIVADVSPDAYCHNKQLGDGYYKIEIFNVINEDASLFRQDSFTKTMGDVYLIFHITYIIIEIIFSLYPDPSDVGSKFMRDDLLWGILDIDGLMDVLWGILDIVQPNTQTINKIFVPSVELIYSYVECLVLHQNNTGSRHSVTPAVALLKKLVFAPYAAVQTSTRLLQVPYPQQTMLGTDDAVENIALTTPPAASSDIASATGGITQVLIEEDSAISSVQYCCDGCSTVSILRHRWHCTVCPDFDLCEACYQVLDADSLPQPHSREHPMSAIRIEVESICGDGNEIHFSMDEISGGSSLLPVAASEDADIQSSSPSIHLLEADDEPVEFPSPSLINQRTVSISASKRVVNSLLLLELVE